MAYSKPQVTIDLEEYNALLKAKMQQDLDIELTKVDIKPYKLALEGIFENRYVTGNEHFMEMVQMSVRSKGVDMLISQVRGSFIEVSCKIEPNL